VGDRRHPAVGAGARARRLISLDPLRAALKRRAPIGAAAARQSRARSPGAAPRRLSMPSNALLSSAAAAAAMLLGAAFVGACAPLAPPAGTSAGDVVAPNPNLVVQGIPPVPRRVADEVARYTDFRGHRFVDWHPLRAEMLIATRKAGADTTQIFRVATPLAEPEQLTDFGDPVRTASYEPTRGDYIVFERATGGDEAAQLYRLDLATRQTTLLTEPGQRHNMQEWLHRSSRLLYLSLPLDRTAAGGSRSEITQTLSLLDPLQPQAQRRLAELAGGGWSVSSVAWDDSQIALTRYLSAAESEVWLLDLATASRRRVLPAPTQAPASHVADVWKRDGSGFFFIGDRAGEFRELMFFRLADGAQQRVARTIPWDIDRITLDASGRLLGVAANVEGRRELRFFDADTFDPLPTPHLPDGSLASLQFHPRLPLLAATLDGSRTPATVGVIDPANGALQRWTTPFAPPGANLASFAEQTIVRWPSFDGREISGLLALPPPRFAGKRPVLVDIHGGPEGQAQVGFLGRSNYFLEELGVAVIRPNVRGSAGFGKTFLSLDDGFKREDSVKDIGALFDWIARQPTLDASRIMVSGGSYGGYMSLAVATNYADRIAGAIDVVGISSFVTFLQNTESYRRDLRRVEYGDERDPAMREFMLRIAPLTNAAKITKPLLVVQGKNDPRVPYTESEQMVARARASGARVWYLRAENEGHGFVRKENADYQFFATVMFMRETLLR
jgi:dipeptidyl aminopeptidase/acylaminoacyl peptidase